MEWASLQPYQHVVWAAVAVLGVVLLAFLSTFSASGRSRPIRHQAARMVRQAIEYAHLAEQDLNPVMAIAHAAMAGSNLANAEMLERSIDLEREVGVDIGQLSDTIRDVQKQAMKALANECPNLSAILQQSRASVFAMTV